jgi:hypothetical protein
MVQVRTEEMDPTLRQELSMLELVAGRRVRGPMRSTGPMLAISLGSILEVTALKHLPDLLVAAAELARGFINRMVLLIDL